MLTDIAAVIGVFAVLAWTEPVVKNLEKAFPPKSRKRRQPDSDEDVTTSKSKRTKVATTKPVKDEILYTNSLKLRWSLLGKQTDLATAKFILRILPHTFADDLINTVSRDSSEIWHIRDTKYVDSEFICFRHATRKWIASYIVLPYLYDEHMGYTALSEAQFFERANFEEKLVDEYRRLIAAKRIKRNIHFKNWMCKPITADGKNGITCRLGWSNIKEQVNGSVGNRKDATDIS